MDLNFNAHDIRQKRFYKPFPLGNLKYSNYFPPHFTKSLEQLPKDIKTEGDLTLFKLNLKLNNKPTRHKHFSRGRKRGNSLLTQVRVGRSILNSHFYSIGHHTESPQHFLSDCPLYDDEQQNMTNSILQNL